MLRPKRPEAHHAEKKWSYFVSRNNTTPNVGARFIVPAFVVAQLAARRERPTAEQVQRKKGQQEGRNGKDGKDKKGRRAISYPEAKQYPPSGNRESHTTFFRQATTENSRAQSS